MKKIFTFLLVLTSLFSFSQSTTLVISQFYGAGGNTGATYNADYVELHNISAGSISLSGMSIQYSSATNTATWTGVSPLPTASIPAGGYYLIQMSSTGAVGIALPAADYVSLPTISMSGSNGKVALVNGLTALTGCPTTDVIDLVGYGTANCFETAATAALTATTGGIRNNNGCTETDNNSNDFTVGTPAPRNSASPVFLCGGGPVNPALTTSVNTLSFGSIVIATNSASQSFNLSGSNLTGAPGNITITSPSTDFQVSNNNTTWGATTTIAYSTATLASTQVYVRFTPQTVGPKSGNVTITGGGVTTTVNVAVSGNGVATAVASVTASALTSFGNVCINATAGPNSFTINGSNLTIADLTVGALAGYTFSTSFGGTYTATLTIPHAAGTFVQDIFVSFNPTASISYNGNIVINGGGLAAATNVPVTGSGINGTATVGTGSASAITQVSAILNGTLSAQGCSPVTAYGFEYSLVSGFVNGTVAASTNLSGTAFSANLAGLLPGTTYYYKAFATNAGGTVYGVQLSFMTASPPPASLSATTLTAFDATCINTTAGPNSFDLTGANLTTANITVGPLNGFVFSATSGGAYTSSLVLTQTGGAYTQTIYVKFTPPAIGTFNGNIPVTGGGVTNLSVPVLGTGSNTIATVNTGDASLISANGALAAGSITSTGCSEVFSYGIEYSGINGFISGSGTKVASSNLSGPDFSSQLSGLVQGTTYYFKAYAVNNGGITYGTQQSFTTLSIPDGLIIYSTPIIRGSNLHYSLNGLKPGHYSARIHNSVGQLVYQKDMIVQVSFIDDNFILPAKLPIGLYNLEIRNHEYKIQKSFMVQ